MGSEMCIRDSNKVGTLGRCFEMILVFAVLMMRIDAWDLAGAK